MADEFNKSPMINSTRVTKNSELKIKLRPDRVSEAASDIAQEFYNSTWRQVGKIAGDFVFFRRGIS